MTAARPSFCTYCNPQDVNDATFKYLQLIRDGLRWAGHTDLGTTNDTRVLQTAGIAVTISCQMAMRALLRKPSLRIVHWFQGIEAVERRHIHGGTKGLLQYGAWSVAEQVLLRRARVKLFVSEQMRHFFADRERSGQRSIVMPCYNTGLEPDAFASPADRYRRLNLVYAGSLFKWQCVEDTLLTFGQILQRRPDARLSIFTRETDRARQDCTALGLGDKVHVESLSPERLVMALRQCSYGFILREHMAINEVSTPTKLSTYLAAGVIPVMTSATPALGDIMRNSPYKVIASRHDAHEQIAIALTELASRAPSPAQLLSSYGEVFADAFDDKRHVAAITQAAEVLAC